MIIYAARHVLPVASPPLRDAAVVVEGDRIVAVGPRGDLLTEAGDAEIRDLGDVVLLPGLINAHMHLDLSWMGGEELPQGDYVAWLRAVVALREREDAEVARQAAESAVGTVVERGTVAVGDVSGRSWIAGLLARTPLWGVVFHELLGFRARDAERLLEEAAVRLDEMEKEVGEARDRIRIALSPHAPHTTSAPLLKALAGRAAACACPLSVHVAESEVETAFLRGGDEAFREFLAGRDAWDSNWTPPGQSPVDYLDRLHVLSPRTLAVHCVHLGQRDLSRLQARGVTVVTCPRSNERLGVGTTPVPKLLAAGIPVALGTDSLASAPDLDLFAELSALLRVHRGLAPAAALRMATINGAAALGLKDTLGSIEPHKLAALVVVPLPTPGADPLETLVSGPERVLRCEAAPWEGQA